VSSGDGLPYRASPEGLGLTLRVQPGAGRDAFAGLAATADGGTALKVKVAAPAEDGRANAAVLALIAGACDLPRRAVTLLQGERDRNKVLALAGDAAELARRLAPHLGRVRSA